MTRDLFAIFLSPVTLVLALGAAPAPGAGKGGERPMDLAATVGREVVLEGTVSRIPWQHMISSRPGKNPDYFDLDDRNQIVVYTATALPSSGRLRLTGTVMKVEGGSKRPGTKIDDPKYVEYQLDVTSWVLVPSGNPVESLLDRLASPDVVEEEKLSIENEVVKLGKEAVPALIAHLGDSRPRRTERTILNEGELMNRPANAPALKPIFRDTAVPLGSTCRRLLYRIVTPDWRPAAVVPGKPRSLDRGAWLFEIPDWPGWWERNKEKPLSVIHEEMRPVIEKALSSPREPVVVQ